MNPISPSARADGDDRITDAFGHGANELVLAHEANAHRVDERIAFIRLVEDDLAGYRRNADAVPVIADSLDDARQQISYAGNVEGSESERVQQRDGSRPHREHVAQDAANAGCRALIGLDGGRMVV